AAALDEADAELARATLNFEANFDGVNTTVAALEAELKQARYYLDNTTMVAPEDGHVVNLQVRPGMVSGIYRVGGIAAFIVDRDRYVLATYYQENLKYVQTGQPAEVALDPYPGQIFQGRVESIWRANAAGQYLPSDVLPAQNVHLSEAQRIEPIEPGVAADSDPAHGRKAAAARVRPSGRTGRAARPSSHAPLLPP